jgi:hypothetical protein
MQETLWIGSAMALTLGAVARWAEKRRSKRKNLDAVGFMPWPLVMVLSILIGAICAGLALHAPK